MESMSGKTSIKEIKELLAEGWKFSLKKTGKYTYIRRRKSGEKDVSMGRLDEELWKIIQAAQKGQTTRYSEIKRRLERTRSMLVDERARRMSRDCANIIAGYCTYWRWRGDEPLIQEFHELNKLTPHKPFETRETDEGLTVKAIPDYCRGCTAYSPR